MALTIADLYKQGQTTGEILAMLGDAARNNWDAGYIKRSLSKSGIDPSVITWYNQNISNAQNIYATERTNAPASSPNNPANPNFVAGGTSGNQSINPINVNPTNDAAQIDYNRRLAAGQVSPYTTGTMPGRDASTTGQIPAIGTTAYTNWLLGGQYFDENTHQQIKDYAPTLTGVSAPTSATDAQAGFPSLNMPTSSPTMGNIGGASAGTAGMSEYLTSIMADLDKQRQEIQGQQEQNKSWLKDFLSSTPTAQETRAQAESAAGMQSAQFFADQKARIAEIQALEVQYNNLVAVKDAQIAQSYDKLASNNFINNQIAQINRNAAPELNRMSANINSKAATLQALQGNFDRAQNYIDQAVQDATADTRFKMEAFAMFYDMNQDTLQRLDTQYQNAFNTAMDFAKMQYEEDVRLKEQLAELQIKNPQATINLNGTLEAGIAAIKNNPTADKGEIFGTAETGYYERYYDAATNTYKTRNLLGGTGPDSPNGTSMDYLIPILQAAIDSGGDANTAALRAIQYAEEQGISLNSTERGKLTALARTLTATPVAPPTTPTGSTGNFFTQPARDRGSSFPGWISNTIDSAKSFFSGLFNG